MPASSVCSLAKHKTRGPRIGFNQIEARPERSYCSRTRRICQDQLYRNKNDLPTDTFGSGGDEPPLVYSVIFTSRGVS